MTYCKPGDLLERADRETDPLSRTNGARSRQGKNHETVVRIATQPMPENGFYFRVRARGVIEE
tara:strand:- start:232 stop:420 length:189 start_codon:yes stop_codon:yes gene_type:complete